MFAESPFSSAPLSSQGVSAGNVNVSVTGVEATGQLGTATVIGQAVVNVTGVQAQGQLGTATVVAKAVVNVTGVEATGQVDSVTVAIVTPVEVSGVEATTTLGNISLITNNNISVTGLEATTQLGEEEVQADANTSVTGVEASGQVGSVEVTADANVNVTGLEGTTQLGSTTVIEGVGVFANVTGVEGTTQLGTATVEAGANVEVTGVVGTTQLGEVEIIGEAVVNVTGVEASALIPLGGSTFTAEGDAQLSTAQFKFGLASLLLDGTDDFVVSDENIDLSSGDFTIDLWIRPDNVTGYKGIWQSGTSTTEQSYLLGNQVYWTVNPSTIITSSVTVSAGVWTMLSYERQGNTHRLYKNGTLEATVSTGNKQDNGPFSVGKNGFGDFDGYIDEVRLSSVARYAGSSFTEPTSSYAVDNSTTALLHFDGTNGSTTIVNETSGGVTVEADANVDATGLETTGSVGSVTVIEGEGILIDITGFLLTASTNDVLVWSDIDDGQTPGWVDINDSQTNGWVDVNDAQSPNWTEIAA